MLATGAPRQASFGQGNVNSSIILAGLNCVGSEASIFDCDGSSINICTHSQDAGAVCAGIYNNKYVTLSSSIICLLNSTQGQLSALMEMSDWSVAPITWKVVWKCATMEHGAQSVMMGGDWLMPMSPAGS